MKFHWRKPMDSGFKDSRIREINGLSFAPHSNPGIVDPLNRYCARACAEVFAKSEVASGILMYYSNCFFVLLMIISSFFLFASCGLCGLQSLDHESPPSRESDIPPSPQRLARQPSQVILVRNMEPRSVPVEVIALERKNDRWQRAFLPMEGVIGRKGFAPPGEKREGDGRTPSGIFPIGTVFGYEPSFPTMMLYRQVTDEDVWVDDAQAADYNRLVKKKSTRASSYEAMRRNDDLYKYGIVVEYNTNPVIKDYGSAIFFHLWRGSKTPTEGCIALSEENLLRILRWLNPEAKPIAVMGTNATIEDLEK